MAGTNEQGNGKLEQAMSARIQTQAILVQTQASNQASYLAQKAETDKELTNIRKEAFEIKQKVAEGELEIKKKMAESAMAFRNKMAEIAKESARLQQQNDER